MHSLAEWYRWVVGPVRLLGGDPAGGPDNPSPMHGGG